MSHDLAVVFDVAGTMLQMCRVAKDIDRGCLMKGIVTAELIMKKKGRALVVPELDPNEMIKAPPNLPLHEFFSQEKTQIEISCSSTPVSSAEAYSIISSSDARMNDLQETYGAVMSPDYSFYKTLGLIVDTELNAVTHAISTGGFPFPGLKIVLSKLEEFGFEIYVASGDSMQSLSNLTRLEGIKTDHIFPVSTPQRKKDVIVSLKELHEMVVMVGDGLNDVYALKAADIGILTVQQDSNPSKKLIESADKIIRHIGELPDILKEIVDSIES
jgi:soluble P-type ATPase